eukprot:CAMPEP_0185202794 /NCGR_PEP_ID=MMETSP1140-20130426/51721_1 /TAXON_ID=298111 /ORGANISM="Pavlova sp., Strain CCMP459" /LENGTH=41 /DNA_ID= /DNA_START= /DNA_END= /DNA_ORIENTATION=
MSKDMTALEITQPWSPSFGLMQEPSLHAAIEKASMTAHDGS